MMIFAPGKSVGEYDIIDVIESSKAGATYKVRNRTMQRFEALKVLPRHAQDDFERSERFLREMKVHARLNHPNIVRFYDARQLEGHYVLTTELLEGAKLERHLELGARPWKECVRIVGAVLSGLSHAHSNGVIHRDITPASILTTADGGVKLIGFTLAKAATDAQLTQVGTVVGSVWYMSPEQIKAVDHLDARTDIYSTGVVLYELLTGKRPFDSQSQFEVMAAHVSKIPTSPSSLNSLVPREFDEIVAKAMAKEPGQRWADAEMFRMALESIGSPAPVQGSPAAVATPALLPESGSQPVAATVQGWPQSSQGAWNGLQLVTAAIIILAAAALFLAVINSGQR